MNNVLILLAADRVTGPAKGLFQFIRHADRKTWKFLFGFFHMRGSSRTTECVPAADALGVPYVIFEQKMRFDPFLVERAYRAIKEHGVTLLQSHSYKGHLLSLIVRRLTGLPWIAFAHGWTEEDRRVRWYNRLDFRLLRYPDRVVAVSGGVGCRLEASGVPAGRIVTIPNAVELPELGTNALAGRFRASIGISHEIPLIAVIGRLSWEKGQDVLLEACRFMARKLPDFVVAIVGEGPSEAALRGQASALDLDGRVRFLGYWHDIASVYADCNLVVIPSRSEGLPNVLLEAMAVGKVVVATEVGGVPEVIQDGVNGRLVPSEEPATMAEVICALLRDPAEQAAISNGAVATARRFSPKVRAREIQKLYADVMKDRSIGSRKGFR